MEELCKIFRKSQKIRVLVGNPGADLISTAFSLINMVAGDSALGAVANVVISVYGLATLIPMISLAVRRLHDIEKSGWWYLLNCIPCIGSIILIVFFCKEGTAGSNRYGDDPKVPNVVF